MYLVSSDGNTLFQTENLEKIFNILCETSNFEKCYKISRESYIIAIINFSDEGIMNTYFMTSEISLKMIRRIEVQSSSYYKSLFDESPTNLLFPPWFFDRAKNEQAFALQINEEKKRWKLYKSICLQKINVYFPGKIVNIKYIGGSIYEITIEKKDLICITCIITSFISNISSRKIVGYLEIEKR